MDGVVGTVMLALIVLAIVIAVASIATPFYIIAISGKLERMLANQERTAREINQALVILTDGKHRPESTPKAEIHSRPPEHPERIKWGRNDR